MTRTPSAWWSAHGRQFWSGNGKRGQGMGLGLAGRTTARVKVGGVGAVGAVEVEVATKRYVGGNSKRGSGRHRKGVRCGARLRI